LLTSPWTARDASTWDPLSENNKNYKEHAPMMSILGREDYVQPNAIPFSSASHLARLPVQRQAHEVMKITEL
jgi:hypothetical protein